MKYLFFLFIILVHFTSYTQTDNSNQDKIFEKVSSSNSDFPEFPGGEQALSEFIKKNLIYPKEAENKKISGLVSILVSINTEGKIVEAKIKKKLGHGCDEEAVRVVNSMPKWSAIPNSNKNFLYKREIPIFFIL